MIWYDKARCQWYIFNGKTIMVFTDEYLFELEKEENE